MEPSQNPVANTLLAFLFAEGGTVTFKRLERLLGVERPIIDQNLALVAERIAASGLSIIQTDTEVTLSVGKGESEALKTQYEKELGREIGDAGLEVLAIVLYRGPSTRSQIDYIRGVNTSSTVRNLLARGLIERTPNPSDSREYLYRPTTELLAHLGATQTTELPEYDIISRELQAFEESQGPFHGADTSAVTDNSERGTESD